MFCWKSALFALVSGLICAGAENVVDPEERLVKYLLNGSYEKSVRPGVVENGRKLPLLVTVLFAPYRIITLDGRLETMALLVYIVEDWLDPRLVWNPKDFGNLSILEVKPEVVWTPRSYLPNLLTLNRDDKAEELSVIINMSEPNASAANVTLVTYAVLQERCDFDMTYFPFDRQRCVMCVSASRYVAGDLVYDSKYELQYTFINGGEWDLESVDAYKDNSSTISSACFVVNVQRRSLYYVINLFVPTVTICVLNIVGLFASIDADQNELDFATMGQTTLLSLGVLLLTVADQTPKGADEVSLLGIFFLAMICQTLLASVTAIYLRKHYRPNQQPRVAALTQKPPAAKVAFGNGDFTKKHAAKLCKILHLMVIALMTVTVIGIGYVNKRKRTVIAQS